MGAAVSRRPAEVGSRNSGSRDLLTTFGRERSERFARRYLGPGFEASAEERVGKDKDARIYFENHSSYRVSYWAIPEDKTRSTAQNKRVVTDMGVALRIGNAGRTASGNASRETEGAVDTEEETRGEEAHFLMRDQRIEPGAETRTTDVLFPKDCRDLRVYGFFEEKGEWQLFKDKVYSIGWFKKVITLTALDESISPYTETRSNEDTTDRKYMAIPSTGPGGGEAAITVSSGDRITVDRSSASSSHRSNLVKRRDVSSKNVFHDERGSVLGGGDASGDGGAAPSTDRPLGQLFERINGSVSEWGEFELRRSAQGVSLSGDELTFDVFRDPIGFVEVRVPRDQAPQMSTVKLDDRVYTKDIIIRGELDTYFIDPVVKGSHEIRFTDASIRYFLGRYDGLLVKFDRNDEDIRDKEYEKGEIGSLAVQEYLPMHRPHSTKGGLNLPWEADGEFTAVWDGDDLWLEAPLTHFCRRGRGWRLRRRTTPPLSPARVVEDTMEFGPIQASGDVVSSRLIRLVNNTQQTVWTCTTPDANPAEQAANTREIGCGLAIGGHEVNAHKNTSASRQHGAMGGSKTPSLGAQHNSLGAGQSIKDSLGGKGDGGVVWYTVDEFTPSNLTSGKFEQSQPQPAQAPAAQVHTPSEHPLVCGFNFARLEVEHGFVVDQASQHFVKARQSLFRLTRPATYPWLIIVRIRHNGRISPGWYTQMNPGKLRGKGVKDFVLRPGEDDVGQTVNQYIKDNLVL